MLNAGEYTDVGPDLMTPWSISRDFPCLRCAAGSSVMASFEVVSEGLGGLALPFALRVDWCHRVGLSCTFARIPLP